MFMYFYRTTYNLISKLIYIFLVIRIRLCVISMCLCFYVVQKYSLTLLRQQIPEPAPQNIN